MNPNELFIVSSVFGPERGSAPCSLPHSPVFNNFTGFDSFTDSDGLNAIASPTESELRLIKLNEAYFFIFQNHKPQVVDNEPLQSCTQAIHHEALKSYAANV